MSRLADRFAALKAEGRTALTTFITAGDPTHAATVPALHALVAGGADVLELGVPFSDPEAEGPAIQASSERGLRNGTTLAMCLDMVREFRKEDPTTPVVLMGYLNSVLAMGERTFATAAGEAGVDGLIMVNLPPEEADVLRPALREQGIDLIFLVAPTTTEARLRIEGVRRIRRGNRRPTSELPDARSWRVRGHRRSRCRQAGGPRRSCPSGAASRR